MKKKLDKIILILICILGIIGLIETLIYIFYSSTEILTSDSVITEVLSHQQRIHNSLFLKNWYYGNEFWVFSLSILTYILSFFINNNLLARQIGVLITAFIFFIIIIKYSNKVFSLKEKMILITIFLSGISYSVLDYFYAFNAYLTVVINSLILIYLFYISVIENKKSKIFYCLLLLFSLLINSTSLRYFPSVMLSLILTSVTLIIIQNKNMKLKDIILKNIKKFRKILVVLLASSLGLCLFILLTNLLHYEQRAGTMVLSILDGNIIVRKIVSVVQCINNFFGFDNRNNPVEFLSGAQYFVKNNYNYSFFSFMSFSMIIKFIMCIFVMTLAPILLFKNYKRNNKFINYLLIFNTFSWIIMIYMYIFTNTFFYNCSELKYFLLNIIINLFMAIYVIYTYISNKKYKIAVEIFLLLYIISNLYTTFLTIKNNNKEAIDKKYELVNTLKKNNLTFGYGCFWSGLLTYFLSDYKITVASLDFSKGLANYKWYSDETWYHTKTNKPVFLIVDKRDLDDYDKYYKKYKKKIKNPDRILKCNDFLIYIYDKDPFINNLK